jgi:prepilin-type N-terminal cleavage/methylation domain-containing protein
MKKYRAYSLIELSIVLFIMAILLTSGGLLFSNISRNQNIKEAQIVTLERTDKIYKAISNYLAENHRLPCPAKLTTASNDKNYGSESRNGEDCDMTNLTGLQGSSKPENTNNLGIDKNMNLIYGMVPIDVLNLNKQDAEDGYGRKFGYAIIKEFGTKTGTNLGFESYSSSQRLGERKAGVTDFEYIKIMDNSTGTEAVITNKAIMLLISHGENGAGAYNPDTGSPISTNNFTSNESDNFFIPTSYDRKFFIDSNETDSSTSQIGVFDDLVIFKTKEQLVRDAGLEFIECSADEGFIYQAYDNECFNTDGTISPKSYGETANITATISALDCGCQTNEAILQRTCGKYGKWSDIFCNENYKLYNLDEVRADSTSGLKLHDDGGNGILVQDGGNVQISATNSSHVIANINNISSTINSGLASLFWNSGGVSMHHYVGNGNAIISTNTNHNLSLMADRLASNSSKIIIKSANGGVNIHGDLRVFYGSATINGNATVSGSLSKGSGSFDIEHPDPKKKDTHRLRHYFVETPSAGGNIYKYQIECKEGENYIDLPDYFEFLNKDSLVWVTPFKHFGRAWGEVKNDKKIKIVAEQKGVYNILVFADRKDEAAMKDFNKYGIEYEIKNK